jgi:U2 small nuclear ribonucleoprotein A'
MSDNDLVRLSNLPLLTRLHTLLLNNNRLAKIETLLGAFVPNLTTLMLSNNKFTGN